MALYQADVLDEELLNHWGTHASKKYVDKDVSKKIRSAASPFLKVSFECDISLVVSFPNRFLQQWLAEAEDDDDEESDDE